MAWEGIVRRHRIEVWTGPYKESAPLDQATVEPSPADSAEFTVQVYAGKRKAGPVFRFPKDITLAEVLNTISKHAE